MQRTERAHSIRHSPVLELALRRLIGRWVDLRLAVLIHLLSYILCVRHRLVRPDIQHQEQSLELRVVDEFGK